MNDSAVPMRPAQSRGPLPAVETPRVPLMDPGRVYAEWGPEAERLVLEILRSHVYVKGDHVARFEKEFAAYVGCGRAVAVDSCTDALFLTLRAVLEECPPDRREVILPTFTFFATAGAVANAGGRPVFADVDPQTHNLALESVAERLNERTAAIVPVHLFGNPADMDGLARLLVGREDVFVLEDAAQAIHATWDGRRVGSIGHAGTFSFYPSKNLAAVGDGGVVTTDDERLGAKISSLRDHGQVKKLYDHEQIGTNSRMDEIQAAVLRVKLPRIDDWTQARRAIAARYDLAFQGTPVLPQRVLPRAESAYHLYTVRVADRDGVRARLEARGIATGVYYPMPLHRQTCFAAYAPDACPVADRLSGEVLSLPLFPGMGREEQDLVIDAVRAAVTG